MPETNTSDTNAPNPKISGQINQKFALGFLAAFAITVAFFLIIQISSVNDQISLPFTNVVNNAVGNQPTGDKTSVISIKGISKFSSEDDFKKFLAEVQLTQTKSGGFGTGGAANDIAAMGIAVPAAERKTSVDDGFGAGEAAGRVSQTNVQVAGIDEPDIVKTDGKTIFYSQPMSYYWTRYDDVISAPQKGGVGVPVQPKGETAVFDAFPPDKLAKSGSIQAGGELLIAKNRLAVFSSSQIYGYDITDPKKPSEVWTIKLEDNNQLVGSRLYGSKIYLVSKTVIDAYHPCPVRPFAAGDSPMIVQCGDIYHPDPDFSADVIYTAVIVDAVSGTIEKSLSFVGSSGSSLLYMSQSGIYVTWGYAGDYIKFYHDFLSDKAAGLVPTYLVERIGRLASYDISAAAKLTEVTTVMSNYRATLSADDRVKFDNELANRLADFSKLRSRELERTGIVKLNVQDLQIVASGSVPGSPLNQFALDEYLGNLRIATTVGGGWSMFGSMGESANDVYVLDGGLALLGSLQDLGLDERIYSARFVNELGYLVTFKQTDPFFVIDLSDPKKPELKGELQIPGYSAYLHPLDKNLVLGIGKENWKVKVSLFDVSLPSKPRELAKYNLDDYWTEVEGNHHAFLLDRANKLFFMPGSKGGYFFSYKNGKLELKKALAGNAVKRALYLGDFFYVVSDDKIIVVSSQNFEKVNELEF
ncbi:MAG TPA: beta-propeller domain-containing protein [Candidatus Paceibacterota bacterium]|nr:beta-propeller domain-containing protein [Candidatus Pacearchaeota archaeon]HRZ50547.1 beta-propeller domain-containing protein [Candidatus Paceibacterota bacterium]HSA36268.1 beta-propeller domain-containing protein [Candidatus Paceibacterota bacterium]